MELHATPRALLARQFATVGEPAILDRRPALTVLVTTAGGLAVFAIVALTGGTPNSLGHLAYVPVVFAAYRSGTRGGLLGALLVAVLLGPVMSAVVPASDYGLPWLVRGVSYVGVGGLVGWLFDRRRSAVRAWQGAAVELTRQQHESMTALAEAAEAKDPTTGDHMLRCRDLAGDLAREAGLAESEAGDIAWSAMLHDIGKLWVPDHVLAKPGELDPEEWDLIRLHTVRGAELLGRSRTFETARRIARWHHENLDGTGYPDGLRGRQIPIEARIVRVVDAWDAMVNDRPYRAALRHAVAMQELRDGAGRAFDPELVEVFLRYLERGLAAGAQLGPQALPLFERPHGETVGDAGRAGRGQATEGGEAA